MFFIADLQPAFVFYYYFPRALPGALFFQACGLVVFYLLQPRRGAISQPRATPGGSDLHLKRRL